MSQKYSIIVLIIIVFSSPLAFGADYYVTPTGNGKKDGSSWTNADNSIQDGINAVGPGDTLYIGGGTYTLSSKLASSRSGSAENIITWTASDHSTYGGAVNINVNGNSAAFRITHDYITLKGTSSNAIKMYGAHTSETWPDYGYVAIFGTAVDHVTNITIDNIEAYYSSFLRANHSTQRAAGVWGEYADHVEVKNSVIYNTGNGTGCDAGWGGGVIMPQFCDDWLIHDNSIHSTMDGIQLGSGINRAKIYNNTIYNCSNQAIATNSGAGDTANTTNEAYDNIVYDCEKGLIVFWNSGPPHDTGWKVYGNLMYYTKSLSEHYAIYLHFVENSYFYNNVIYDGGYNSDGGCPDYNNDFVAVRSDSNADNNYFYNNTIYSSASGSTIGFWFWSGSSGNTLKNNTIYMNSAKGKIIHQSGSDPNKYNYNCYYAPNNSNAWTYNNNDITFANWKTSFIPNQDQNTKNGNPGFKNTSNLPDVNNKTKDGLAPDPNKGSALIDNGVDSSQILKDDFLRRMRIDIYDIGAYEHGSYDTSPPAPPNGLRIK